MGPDSQSGRAAIAAVLQDSLPALVADATEAIWNQVPAYAAAADPKLRDDVAAHVESIFSVFLAGLTEDRQARRADFAVTRDQATRRLSQGISLADFLQAFHIGQLTLWQGVLKAAQDDQLAERDRLRRDLVEDLLARRTTFAGQKRSLLQAASLGSQTSLLVASAAPTTGSSTTGSSPPPSNLAAAASAIAGAGRGGGLAALRQDEIVGVLPLPHGGAEAVVSALRRVRAGHLRLAIGVSTVHAGLHEVPEAYAEAQAAREALGSSEGVLALPLLSAFDYLMLTQA